MPDYTIVASKNYQGVDSNGNLSDFLEVRFTWGENHEGTVRMKESDATAETIQTAIVKHISKFDGLS